MNVLKRTSTVPAVDLNQMMTSVSIDSFLDPIEINTDRDDRPKNDRENSAEKTNPQNISTVDLTKTLPARAKKKVNITRSVSYNIGRLTGSSKHSVNSNTSPGNDATSHANAKSAKPHGSEASSKVPLKILENSQKQKHQPSIKTSLTSINDITGKAKSYVDSNNFKLTNASNTSSNSVNGNINNIPGSLSQNFMPTNHYSVNSKSSDKIYSIAGTINSATANSTSAVNTLNKINKNEALFGIIYDFLHFSRKKGSFEPILRWLKCISPHWFHT